jgi:hypothetical protein
VRDHNGQALAFAYCEDEFGTSSSGQAALTRDVARWIAAKGLGN